MNQNRDFVMPQHLKSIIFLLDQIVCIFLNGHLI
jgi:hypothetical protein